MFFQIFGYWHCYPKRFYKEGGRQGVKDTASLCPCALETSSDFQNPLLANNLSFLSCDTLSAGRAGENPKVADLLMSKYWAGWLRRFLKLNLV